MIQRYLPWNRLTIKEKTSAWTIIRKCCSPYYTTRNDL